MPEKRIVAMDASVPAQHTAAQRRARVRNCTWNLRGGKESRNYDQFGQKCKCSVPLATARLVWEQPPRLSSQAKRGARRRFGRRYGAVTLPGRTLFSRRGTSGTADFREILERFLHDSGTLLPTLTAIPQR